MVYFTSCADAYAHGYANIHRGQPGYRSGLDADHDNVACDTPPAHFTPHPSTSPSSTPSKTPSHHPSHTKTSAVAGVPAGGGPQLPLTGPGEAITGGLLLALAGVAVTVAVRRRKHRFVA